MSRAVGRLPARVGAVSARAPEQIEAIAAMQLTGEDQQAYYTEAGLVEEKTPLPDATPQSASGGTGSSMRDLSQEDREATKVALVTPEGEVGTGTGSTTSRADVLMDDALALLGTK